MKFVLALGFAAMAFAQTAPVPANPGLAKVKSVYVLPMANGFDQYLVNQLQADKVLVVVTDPANADAIFTDNIGPVFEHKMTELYPPQATKEEDEDENMEKNDPGRTRISSFRRGKGVVFLVDRSNRQVIWSTYRLPKSTTPKDMNRAADHVSEQLRKAATGK